jgi:hypothetical protein
VIRGADSKVSVGQSEQAHRAKYQRLLYRSQFVLGPCFVDIIPAAQRLTIGPDLHLTAHPDLNVQIANDQQKTLVLLGFILDPDDPGATNADIIESLVRNFNDCTDLFSLTDRFGGRWILIAADGTRVVLFHDPAGLRQVFYSDLQKTHHLWCGSQSAVIADLLELVVDGEAVDFINSSEISAKREYWWPGESTPYKEIRHLVPNHYLNLFTGTCHRYWPCEDLRPLSVDAAVGRCSVLLRGLLASAANRFDLALPVTAGWDSRLLLAASKPIRDRLSYFTLKIEAANLSETHPDLAVPRALSSRLGLRHEVIEQPGSSDGSFSKLFKQNVTLAHDTWCLDAQAIFEFYGLRKVVIGGGVSEAARNFYSLPHGVESIMTGEKLASLTGMRNHPFAVKCFEGWLKNVDKTCNLRTLDLFYWEQRAGNWLAMCQQEFDIAWQEIFSPYNCRLLLANMLSVKRKYRRAPTYLFYKKLMLNLWPEVLEEPINPHKVKSPMQQIKKGIRRQLSNVKRFVWR